MMTSFTRIIISLSFLRSAIGTQQNPPNMVLIGIALFLTLFIMNPVLTEIQQNAYEPYRQQAITQEQALERAEVPLKRFMLRQTEQSSLNMFCDLAQVDAPASEEEAMALSMRVVVPSYMTSEHGYDYAPAGDDLHAVQAAVVCHGGWMATVVFHAGAGLPIAVEKGGCHSGSKSGDGYSAAGDVGCSQDRRANADCKYGGRHTGCYFSGGDTDP